MRVSVVQITPTNPLLGVLAVFVALTAFSDAVPLMEENTLYFETAVPARLVVYFILGGVCMFSTNGLVANNLVFTYAFLEIWLNFLAYNNLRDEKYYRAKQYLEDHGAELREHEASQVVAVE